jgi:excinuclease UvrABC nuclease subunit
MKVQELTPELQHQVAFDLYSLSRIPDCAGCYCLTNATGQILYIGQSVSMRSRLAQHFYSDKRISQTPLGRVSVAWWRVADPSKLSALERGWIESVRLRDGALPPLNRVSAPT